jgi:hypothetical protein
VSIFQFCNLPDKVIRDLCGVTDVDHLIFVEVSVRDLGRSTDDHHVRNKSDVPDINDTITIEIATDMINQDCTNDDIELPDVKVAGALPCIIGEQIVLKTQQHRFP